MAHARARRKTVRRRRAVTALAAAAVLAAAASRGRPGLRLDRGRRGSGRDAGAVHGARDDAGHGDGRASSADDVGARRGGRGQAEAGEAERQGRARPAGDHRRPDLAEVGRRVGNRPLRGPEHDVPPHRDRVRPLGEARRDDPRHRQVGEARLSEVRRSDVPGRPGRGRLHARRGVRVRLQLLDVRAGLRARRIGRLRPGPVRRQLRLPHRHGLARDRCRRSRSGRCRSSWR